MLVWLAEDAQADAKRGLGRLCVGRSGNPNRFLRKRKWTVYWLTPLTGCDGVLTQRVVQRFHPLTIAVNGKFDRLLASTL